MAGESSAALPSERQLQLSGKRDGSAPPSTAGGPNFGSLVMLFKRSEWELDIDSNLKLVLSSSFSFLL